MSRETEYYIVAASALPDVFPKVAEANRMLLTGEAKTAGEAARRAGISRSAFYKYRDTVMPYTDMRRERIVTVNMMLKDKPGALSEVLDIFAAFGANILTINQTIPTNACAVVTVSAETATMKEPPDRLFAAIRDIPGVLRFGSTPL